MRDETGTPPLKRHWLTRARIQAEGHPIVARTRDEHLQGCTWFRITELVDGAWMEGWAERPDQETAPPKEPGP